jgi:hypothetical protein
MTDLFLFLSQGSHLTLHGSIRFLSIHPRTGRKEKERRKEHEEEQSQREKERGRTKKEGGTMKSVEEREGRRVHGVSDQELGDEEGHEAQEDDDEEVIKQLKDEERSRAQLHLPSHGCSLSVCLSLSPTNRKCFFCVVVIEDGGQCSIS